MIGILVKECIIHNLGRLARRNIYLVCKMLYYYIIFDERARAHDNINIYKDICGFIYKQTWTVGFCIFRRE